MRRSTLPRQRASARLIASMTTATHTHLHHSERFVAAILWVRLHGHDYMVETTLYGCYFWCMGWGVETVELRVEPSNGAVQKGGFG